MQTNQPFYEPLKQINTMQATMQATEQQSATTKYHPIHNCYDGIITTISGKKIDLRNPTEDVIDITDIASALSKICRFNGQTNRFYSVAQHSIIVAHLVPDELKKEALLHDASEAYLGDVIKPLKLILGNAYSSLEKNFEAVIYRRFGLPVWSGGFELIKQADARALEIEHECFRKNNIKPFMAVMELLHKDVQHPAYSHGLARTMFLGAYKSFFNSENSY